MFEIYTVTGVNASGVDFNEEGRYDYITRTSLNRGIHSHIDAVEGKIIQPEGTYSLGLLGMDFFYRDEEWFAGQFVRGVRYKDVSKSNNHLISLYLEVVISKYKEVMKAYLVKNIDELFRGIELELPVLTPEDTTPYWDYMAYFIHNIQQQYADKLEAKSEYELNLMCQILGLTREDIAQRVAFTQPQYTSKFTVGELFGVKSIKQVPSGFTPNFVDDGIPYLSQKTGGSYGVNGYLNPEEVDGELELITEGMIVTGVDNVANGVMYWWDEPFYANKMVGITHKDLDKWTAQYIITLLLKQYSGYDYNNKISIAVIKDTELELPVLAPNSKQIDWDAIRHVAVGGGVNYLATCQEICNRDLAIIRQLIQ